MGISCLGGQQCVALLGLDPPDPLNVNWLVVRRLNSSWDVVQTCRRESTGGFISEPKGRVSFGSGPLGSTKPSRRACSRRSLHAGTQSGSSIAWTEKMQEPVWTTCGAQVLHGGITRAADARHDSVQAKFSRSSELRLC
ncbi:hypothetical protein MPTK1_6g14410 [Marchantia polymorpha subsp. ruderalis]|uniref:Uncharacterized protein n=2 Tax=Marchantia polymorpha TaxID=3197 RepID=A0AAF6BRZ4_MARPO|nr:hypothetical protein MARPO_0047s0095 [Marchantia polymorpha]BBN14778.1 hypothetical protein Mp_6g14410 [Marchantia polymorpha subsp. ruderalis]|eukprot:PTQ39121.1 hypothetical protein MARPO_0047s0095 [Marchantia polymorpha]